MASIYKTMVAFVLATAISCRPQTTYWPVTDSVIYSPEADLLISDSEKVAQPQSQRTILIEKFKSKVLRHLNKTTPPVNDISPPRLPKEVIAHLSEQRVLSDAKFKEDILIRPSNSNSSCQVRANCSRFEFTAKQDIETIKSVQLLFYKTDSLKNLSVTIFSSTEDGADPVINLKDYHSKSKSNSGLVAFELPKTLALESKSGEVSCTAEVDGLSVLNDDEYSPILILTKIIVKEEKSRRTARSNANCRECCLESNFVTVEELGWADWVVTPRIFNIGNCVGQCTETLTFYKTQYQTIRNTLHKKNNTRYPKPTCAFWELGCKPTRLLSQEIVYHNNETIIQELVPKMVIEACECS